MAWIVCMGLYGAALGVCVAIIFDWDESDGV